MKVLVADDESVARRRLHRLLSAMPDVELVGECATGQEVLDAVGLSDIDVLLLDIRMPGLSGMDALALLPADGPVVVFCTAHPDHAVEAFDHGAIDYLLKPVEAGRLRRALDRAALRGAGHTAEGDAARVPDEHGEGGHGGLLSRLAIRTRGGIVLVDPGKVTHAVLEDQLVTVHGEDGRWVTDFSLQDLEARLPADRFFRVHRQALLNLAYVERLDPLETGGFVARTTTGHLVSVSRQAARILRRRLGL